MTYFVAAGTDGVIRFDLDNPDIVQEVLEEEMQSGRLIEDTLDAMEEYDGVTVIRPSGPWQL